MACHDIFVLAETGEPGQRAVCIDEAYEGFNDDEGEALFDDGETTPILQQAMDFLEEYQKQYQRTEAFVQRLRDNDLLMSLGCMGRMVDRIAKKTSVAPAADTGNAADGG